MDPNRQSMIHLFQRSGISLSRRAADLMWAFHSRIRARSDTLDLTRIRNFESMVIKHYVDSAIVPHLVELPSPLLDIGSGAGLPGIPIKIVRPELRITLAEGRERRVAFLEETCRLLKLKDIDVYPHKVNRHFDRPVQGVITRALETVSGTLDRVGPFLPEGGRVIFMKGPGCQDELDTAIADFQGVFRLTQDVPYTLPATSHQRRLIVFERRSRDVYVVPGKGTGPLGASDGRSGNGRVKTKHIVSSSNPTFKMLLRLNKAKGIKKHALALLSGPKQVREVITDFPERVAGIVREEDAQMPQEAVLAGLPQYVLRKELFLQVDFHETRQPIALIRVPPFPAWSESEWPPGCTLFVPFQDPSNVGAMVRTAAAFGVSRLVFLQESAHPFQPKSLRVAGSTIFRIPLVEGPSLSALRVGRTPLVALSPEGETVAGFHFPPSFGLVPGLEGPGLPGHLRKATVLSIPMKAGVESLNAAMAAGIILYLWSQSLVRTP